MSGTFGVNQNPVNFSGRIKRIRQGSLVEFAPDNLSHAQIVTFSDDDPVGEPHVSVAVIPVQPDSVLRIRGTESGQIQGHAPEKGVVFPVLVAVVAFQFEGDVFSGVRVDGVVDAIGFALTLPQHEAVLVVGVSVVVEEGEGRVVRGFIVEHEPETGAHGRTGGRVVGHLGRAGRDVEARSELVNGFIAAGSRADGQVLVDDRVRILTVPPQVETMSFIIEPEIVRNFQIIVASFQCHASGLRVADGVAPDHGHAGRVAQVVQADRVHSIDALLAHSVQLGVFDVKGGDSGFGESGSAVLRITDDADIPAQLGHFGAHVHAAIITPEMMVNDRLIER